MSKKVRLGQYYTSKEVSDFMVSLSDTNKKGKVVEPGHGEGVFLDSLLAAGYKNIFGYDIDNYNHNFVKNKLGQKTKLSCQSFLDVPVSSNPDLIIGNPPYVKFSRLDNQTKETLGNDFWKNYTNGEWDLLYAFILWSVEILKNEGELIFIVPYNWFNATNAQSLRDYLVQSGYFTDIICFHEYKVFDDAAPNAIIFKYIKSEKKEKPPIRTVELKNRNYTTVVEDIKNNLARLQKSKDFETEGYRCFLAKQPIEGTRWHLANRREEHSIKKLESKATKTLGEIASVGVGFVSGYDSAFAVTDETYKKLNDNERLYVRNFVKAKDCSPYHIKSYSRFLFLDDCMESEIKEMPTIYKLLKPLQPRLIDRYGVPSDEWWRWATVRNEQLFIDNRENKKIFVPGIDRSLNARYCVTKEFVFGGGDVLGIFPNKGVSADYLCAWLNSSCVADWYNIKGANSGHRKLYTQAIVSSIPYLDPEVLDPEDYKTVVVNSRSLQKGIKKDREEKIAEINSIFKRAS